MSSRTSALLWLWQSGHMLHVLAYTCPVGLPAPSGHSVVHAAPAQSALLDTTSSPVLVVAGRWQAPQVLAPRVPHWLLLLLLLEAGSWQGRCRLSSAALAACSLAGLALPLLRGPWLPWKRQVHSLPSSASSNLE